MKNTLIWAAIFGATGIAFGALGAHALKSVLTANQLASFEVGVRYQMYHALFLLIVGLMQHLFAKAPFVIVKNLIVLGILFFSGSIYLLSLQSVIDVKLSFLGPVTPLGGILLISGWILFMLRLRKLNVD